MATLITVADYKSYAGITSTKFDTQISNIVTAISAIIKTYCNRTFVDYASTDKTEYFSIANDATIFVEEIPIISVTSLKVRLNPRVAYTTLVENTDFVVEEGQIVHIDPTTGGALKFPHGPLAVELKYKAGFTTVPGDLKIAAMDMVTFYMKKEATQEVMMMSKSPSNISRSANDKQVSNFPPHISRILNYYRTIL